MGTDMDMDMAHAHARQQNFRAPEFKFTTQIHNSKSSEAMSKETKGKGFC